MKSSVKGKKKGLSPTQIFLPIAEIRDDLAVLKNGGIRAVLQVSAVNFNLKSENEQNALIYGYQSFLNTLGFPIQIVVRSRKLDVDNYLTSFETIAKKHDKQLLKDLSYDYIEYVQKLVEYADIMEKQFYVVVPFDPIRSQERGALSVFLEALKPRSEVGEIRQRHHEFESLKKGVGSRVDIVKAGLENYGLSAEQLSTSKLVELYYQSFNPVVSRSQKGDNFEQETVLNI